MIKLKLLLENIANDYRISKNKEFREYIKRVEGKRLDAYDLGDGMITIGYGHAQPKGKSKYKIGQRITDAEAEQLLVQDIRDAEAKVNSYIQSNFPNIKKLSLLQKQMLTDFAYNPGLSKFPKFVNAVVTKDWKTANQEYKRYTGGRELGRNQEFYNTFLSKVNSAGTDNLDADSLQGTSPLQLPFKIASSSQPSKTQLTANDITVSPNPVNSNMQVTITIQSEFLPYDNIQLAIMSSTGKVIDTHAWNNVTRGILKFNAPDTAGLYFITIIADSDKVATKLQVQ